ncbi:MAG: polysaccharide deacetylase family protein [Calditrichia bacterium]
MEKPNTIKKDSYTTYSPARKIGSFYKLLEGENLGKLRVLTYHRVLPPSEAGHLDPRTISADPVIFEKHMRFLKKHFRVLRIEEILSAIYNGEPLPPKSIWLTFDDGGIDFYKFARPVLKALGLTATVFVPTAFPEEPFRPFWWDQIYHSIKFKKAPLTAIRDLFPQAFSTNSDELSLVKDLQQWLKNTPVKELEQMVQHIRQVLESPEINCQNVMNWSQLEEIQSEGFSVGAHTHNHAILTRLPYNEMKLEVELSLTRLYQKLGIELPIFSYPNGNYNREVLQVMGENKVVLAVTCDDGINRIGRENPLTLKRSDITRKTGPFLFKLRVQPFFAKIDEIRHRPKSRTEY